MNLKNLNIRSVIKDIAGKSRIKMQCICNFLMSTEEEVVTIYKSQSLDTEILMNCWDISKKEKCSLHVLFPQKSKQERYH